jgi:putative molybdopterin biosynthesis protein
MKQPDTTVKCNVKQYRMANGWSQQQLADMLNVRRQAIYDIENDRYMPNTAISLRLAKLFGCRVEDLFTEAEPENIQTVHLINGEKTPFARLALGRVRNRLVGIPLRGTMATHFGLVPADGLLDRQGEKARIFSSQQIEKTIILMGCDPAFEILNHHISRLSPHSRIHCLFASSSKALASLADGMTHLAGTHFHNSGKKESNVEIASRKLGGMKAHIIGFSLLEEGLMVAKNNPLGIRSVADLAQPMVRFVNRDPGAALRTLVDDLLAREGIKGSDITGYHNEAASHREGAYQIACHVADAALGLRVIAEIYGLDFVSLTSVRCDLVIPDDMMNHPTVEVITDILQSSRLQNEINAIPGYESSATGRVIATL